MENPSYSKVGNVGIYEALPEDCAVCHSAKMGTILVEECIGGVFQGPVCLDCLLANNISGQEAGINLAHKIAEHLIDSSAEKLMIPVEIEDEVVLVIAKRIYGKKYCCHDGCENDAEFIVTYNNRRDPDNETHACMEHVGEMLGTVMGHEECCSWTVTRIGG